MLEEPATTWTQFIEMNMKSDRIENEQPKDRLLDNGAEALTDVARQVLPWG